MALVWHMHQPLYKDRLTGEYQMPWVRLHAQKDYVDMLAVLEPYPGLRQTFNLVPSLLEQVQDYAEHGASDRALALLTKPVAALTADDQGYILARFFDLNWARMLAPHPRYAELASKRDGLRELPFEEAAAAFGPADWADLTVWFNLAWFDPHWLASEPVLEGLVAKGRGFDQADREALAGAILAMMRRVVPSYKAMAERGQIELTTTPYYHPILPLLCDRDSARVARPDMPLPASHFAYPEDATAQIEKGLAYFETLFGRKPRGMWPSEQSVSPQALALLARSGVKWAISDEGILAHTLGVRFTRDAAGRPFEMSRLYQPYRVETPAGPVDMVFRDIVLSDLIGFTYAQMAPEAAAEDLHRRLTAIRQVLPDGGEPYLVTIALDGENCWEHYPSDGAPFLHAFYRRFAADPHLEMVTVGDYLDRHPPRARLEDLFSGSWIGSDFSTWIGEPTKNRAWEALYRARADLVAAEPRLAGTPAWEAAWEEVYIAEGSDWFWWFGEGHDSGQDERFDLQFRLHLQNVYALLGLEPPDELCQPLTEAVAGVAAVPLYPALPLIDGSLTDAAWQSAGVYDPTTGQGAMHAAAKYVRRLYAGRSASHLFLGLAFAEHVEPQAGDELALYFYYPGQVRHNSALPYDHAHVEGRTREFHYAHALRVRLGETPVAVWCEAVEYGHWREVARVTTIACGKALEVAVPLALLGQPVGQEVQFVVAAVQQERLVEVLPPHETIGFTIPAMEAMASS